MIRKLTLALCIATGATFAMQSAAFAEDKKDATGKTATADPATDKLIKEAQSNADAATKAGKTALASAYSTEIAAYNKLKDAKASGNADAIKTAKAEVEKAAKAVDEAKKKKEEKKK